MEPAETTGSTIRAEKRRLREECTRRRRLLADKPALSRRIFDRLVAMREYRDARLLSTYVAMPAEVQTEPLIHRAWSDGKDVAVPCCVGDEIRLFRLQSMEDLTPGTLGILEPRSDLRESEERWCDAPLVDLFIVPGVAFDPSGGRVGYGKGYYDRLFSRARQNAPRIALAFECQIVDRVPMTESDVFMNCVISECCVRRPSDR